MLYEILNQSTVFLIMFTFGFLSGLIFDLFKLLNYFFKNNKILRQIFIFIGTIFCFFVFCEVNLKFNYGDVRFFTFLAFCLAVITERFTVGKVLTKFLDKCYNSLNQFAKGLLRKFHGREKKEKNN